MTAKIKRARKNHSHRHPHRPRGVSHKAFAKVYWPYIPVVLIISFLLSVSFQTGALSAIVRHPDGKVLSYATSMSINGLLESTNAARAQNSVSGLAINDRLDSAAQAKANDMAARDYWSHNTPDGNPPWVFVTAENYAYQKLGENLAAGFGSERSTVNGWLVSPPHRENLLDPAFSQVGFGFANSQNYTAGNGSPMTIVVAFYGEPQVLAQQTATSAMTVIPPVQSAGESSRAQLALANLPIAKFGTTLVIVAALVTVGVWLGRHGLAVRRALIYGERFAVRHPLLDIGLLIIAALLFLLSQTAGFIQ